MFVLLYVSEVVKKDIPKLDRVIKNRIRKELESKLKTQPEVFGVPLQKSLKNYRKLRVGNYRIIFRIEKNMVRIFAIGHRSTAYDRVKSRTATSAS